MIFGKKIKELREEHGMVQRKLAAALDRLSLCRYRCQLLINRNGFPRIKRIFYLPDALL